MTDADVAWAAGLFDGEGSVSLLCRVTGSGGYTWCVSIALMNTHIATVERFQSVVGTGKVYKHPTKEGQRRVYRWVASARQAEAALRLLEPYSFTKKEQVALALEARSLKQAKRCVPIPPEVRQRLAEIRAEIKSCNTGRPVPLDPQFA